MPETHAYEAACPCGSRWRVYLAVDADDDEPVVECLGCGADVVDLVDIGNRSAGPGTM